ncbi:MAG: DNA-protecting protein DprA [Ruminococcaceae bacterium]|nr:DNA-protecting protein DprA [Oscillospiraceae bacterium]
MSSDLLYWVWLAERLGPASRRLPGLLARFESAYEIYRAEPEEITGFDLHGNEKLYRLEDKNLDSACKTVEYCKRHGIEIIAYDSEKYPSKLRKLQDPPAVLYVRGNLPQLDNRVCIAVVGTRKMSEYGKTSAYKISYELAAAGAIVVSGMALGVDSFAACGAISAKGETVAVCGCGVDRAYPTKHKRLMEKIIDHGCAVSEYPPHTPPYDYNFPARNRIISGMCNGTLVIEGDGRSGALITARTAIIQGRDIYALPGNIDSPGSEGTNKLIHDGAVQVRSAYDILENYRELYSDTLDFGALERAQRKSNYTRIAAMLCGLSFAEKEEETEKEIRAVKAEEKEIPEAPKENINSAVEALDEKTRTVYDAIPEGCEIRPEALTATGISLPQIMAALTVLEIRGLVTQRPGGAYIRK